MVTYGRYRCGMCMLRQKKNEKKKLETHKPLEGIVLPPTEFPRKAECFSLFRGEKKKRVVAARHDVCSALLCRVSYPVLSCGVLLYVVLVRCMCCMCMGLGRAVRMEEASEAVFFLVRLCRR